LETLAEALAHTIGVGLLKQPDKQKASKPLARSECVRALLLREHRLSPVDTL